MVTHVNPLQFARKFSLSSIYLHRHIHKSVSKENVIRQNAILKVYLTNCSLKMGFYQIGGVIVGLVLDLAVFGF